MTSLPVVPGFAPPVLLRDFLAQSFGVKLSFGDASSNRETAAAAAATSDDGSVVVVPPPHFAVFVYVPLGAAPPPLSSSSSVPPQASRGLIQVGRSSSRGQALASCLAVAARKPLTSKVLRHAFWSSLFSRLAHDASTFLAKSCAVVVQFAACHGGLQVLGPSLSELCPPAAKRARRETDSTANAMRAHCPRRLDPCDTLLQRDLPRTSMVSGSSPVRTLYRGDLAADILRSCWLLHHPSSLSRLGLQRDSANGQRTVSDVVVGYDIAEVCLPDAGMSGAAMKAHLAAVVTLFIESIARLNLRGATIACCGNIEAATINNETATAGDAVASISCVIRYLRMLLRSLSWDGGSGERSSFWGDEESVLGPLLATAERWLQFGRRGKFPLHAVLDRVKVNSVPWLAACAVVHRKRRSCLQQRAFAQFGHFLFATVLPFLVRQSFHVTVSTKNPNHLVFFPKRAWIAISRRAFATLCCDISAADCTAMRLTAASSADVRSHALSVAPAASNARGSSSSTKITPNIGSAKVCRRVVLYSSLRLLPDGRKLRPICFVRGACPSALARMVRRQVQDPLAGGSNNNKNSKTAQSRATKPHTTCLRSALRCLEHGMAARRAAQGAAKNWNLSHADEYPVILAFVRECRALSQSLVVHAVRGDAVRCYDRLPQQRVIATMRELVPHSAYYRLSFTALSPRRNNNSNTNNNSNVDTTVRKRPWQTTLSQLDIDGARIDIPAQCILLECEGMDEVIYGDSVREALERHLSQHLVSVGGTRLFRQQVGIPQGSNVAMLLCDAVLEEAVDCDLARCLGDYHEPSLVLRRVDDVLAASLSGAAIDACHRQLLEGWNDVGFACNRDKLECDPPSVRWCGLLFWRETQEWSVEWSRVHVVPGTLHVRPNAERDTVGASCRVLNMLQMRMPLTVLCRTLNTRRRVLLTLYEAAFVWADLTVKILCENVPWTRPHVRCILRPLAVAVAALSNHVARLSADLLAKGSLCDVARGDVNLIVVSALRRVLKRDFAVLRARDVRRKSFWAVMLGILERKWADARAAIEMVQLVSERSTAEHCLDFDASVVLPTVAR